MTSVRPIPVFDPDETTFSAVALHQLVREHDTDRPMHRHRKGQLILSLHGAVTCQVEDALWIVPRECGVWIPSGMPHSSRPTANARLCYLHVEPGLAALPHECCTLSISPMLREMILHLASADVASEPTDWTDRFARVLIEELARMPVESLSFPVSKHPKVRRMAEALHANPADRQTAAEWAARLATSERSLARLIVDETGMTFGRWRQQLQLLVAIRELANGATVQAVSETLGYESVTAFIVMFKKALGDTPARYFARRGQKVPQR